MWKPNLLQTLKHIKTKRCRGATSLHQALWYSQWRHGDSVAPAYRQSANLTETKLYVTKKTKTKSSERLHNPTTSPETSAVAARLQRGGNAASAGWQRCNPQITSFCLKKQDRQRNISFHQALQHLPRQRGGSATATKRQGSGKGNS